MPRSVGQMYLLAVRQETSDIVGYLNTKPQTSLLDDQLTAPTYSSHEPLHSTLLHIPSGLTISELISVPF